MTFHDIVQPEGSPLVPPVDMGAVDARRRAVYQSWETFLRTRLEMLDRDRPELWRRDYSSPDAYEFSLNRMRKRLREILGLWAEPAQRPPVVAINPQILLETDQFTARRFDVELVPSLITYAVELIPKTAAPHPGLLLQHGYGGTPEGICGLTPGANAADYSYRSLGLRAVQRGYRVLAVLHPAGYGTVDENAVTVPAADPAKAAQYGHNRLHRLATLVGGSLLGLYIFASSRGIDVLRGLPGVQSDRIGMYGLSQGGQCSLYLPAMDTRVRATVVSGYFEHRLAKLIGPHRVASFLDWHPEDPFLRDLIRTFSDADVVSLIAPRAVAIEAGLEDNSVDFEKAQAEFDAAKVHYEKLGIPDRIAWIAHRQGHVSATGRAMEFLDQHLKGS